ncbi:3,5-dihydroxyphenylacetyl-CoA synthase DpgA [Actinacidiphila guanduensis]|jgi:alkylresorcinol/alkylpyrone synthase/polyketide synthase Type III|uniref:(3,5-dihydroxycyclohex-3-enyl)acetyl-CoA synthase n=1 Tax=Actinacidiphila guanduensis TaxID=310781 RepID=A0A1H0FN61_9ACTN|nr:3,5-dihydroxyphenylacetyl-CoA synthase DpgA [Actinacidiphila guanduensis]SDN96106.1 (3,5-dihydroxycyclohex-3-enyl)acetyl-CoA synthase [Actinacidiphila guanduensis]
MLDHGRAPGAGTVSFPRLLGVGTANPATSYTQEDILRIYGIDDPTIVSVFRNSHIAKRHLQLPPPGPDGAPVQETQAQLLRKHRDKGIELAAEALRACLAEIGAGLDDLGYLCCVTSTGLLTPGFSALLIKELGIPVTCSRLDVVGMGCNAGLNGLNPTAAWAARNPGRLAVMICVESCSAAYVFDGTMRTAVVNGLFGDGAAAVAVRCDEEPQQQPGPQVVKFTSLIIPEAVDAMRFDWDEDHGKYSFFLDRDVPYVVGAHAEQAIGNLLAGTGLRRSDIAQWIVHSGGKKVIDAVKINLGLTSHDVRHTTSVLRDYGNLSSGSFLFSLDRLRAEGRVEPGEYVVLMTMGPGSTIENALVRW